MYKLILLSLSILTFYSCASNKELTGVRKESAHLWRQIKAMKAEQKRLKKAIQEMQQLTQQLEKVNQTYADIRLKIQELSRKTEMLNDRIEEAHKGNYWKSSAPSLDKSNISNQTSSSIPQTTPTDEAYEQAGALYRAAYKDMVKGQYKLARQSFQQFLSQFPNSELADNAQYWLAETHYAQKKYSQAAQAFAIVLSKYPNGDKNSAALLKLAYSEIELKQLSKARKNLELLIKKFPNSNETNLARSRLKTLKQ